MNQEERKNSRGQAFEIARRAIMNELRDLANAYDDQPTMDQIIHEMIEFIEFSEILHLSTIMSAFGTCMGNAKQAEIDGHEPTKQLLVSVAKDLIRVCERDFRENLYKRLDQTIDHIGVRELYEAEESLTTNERTFNEIMEELRREEDGGDDAGQRSPEE